MYLFVSLSPTARLVGGHGGNNKLDPTLTMSSRLYFFTGHDAIITTDNVRSYCHWSVCSVWKVRLPKLSDAARLVSARPGI